MEPKLPDPPELAQARKALADLELLEPNGFQRSSALLSALIKNHERVLSMHAKAAKSADDAWKQVTALGDKVRELSDRLEDKGEVASSDPVNHPKHYTQHASGVECIDVVEHMGFNLGNAVKYLWRCDHKGKHTEDLEKAIWYIRRELEKRAKDHNTGLVEPKEPSPNSLCMCGHAFGYHTGPSHFSEVSARECGRGECWCPSYYGAKTNDEVVRPNEPLCISCQMPVRLHGVYPRACEVRNHSPSEFFTVNQTSKEIVDSLEAKHPILKYARSLREASSASARETVTDSLKTEDSILKFVKAAPSAAKARTERAKIHRLVTLASSGFPEGVKLHERHVAWSILGHLLNANGFAASVPEALEAPAFLTPPTVQALRDFQVARGLVDDGKPTPLVWEALIEGARMRHLSNGDGV